MDMNTGMDMDSGLLFSEGVAEGLAEVLAKLAEAKMLAKVSGLAFSGLESEN
jgi:hypothetical protein